MKEACCRALPADQGNTWEDAAGSLPLELTFFVSEEWGRGRFERERHLESRQMQEKEKTLIAKESNTPEGKPERENTALPEQSTRKEVARNAMCKLCAAVQIR